LETLLDDIVRDGGDGLGDDVLKHKAGAGAHRVTLGLGGLLCKDKRKRGHERHLMGSYDGIGSPPAFLAASFLRSFAARLLRNSSRHLEG
jgi:hypothetical protein